jgi:hypothetical protein
MFIFRFNG